MDDWGGSLCRLFDKSAVVHADGRVCERDGGVHGGGRDMFYVFMTGDWATPPLGASRLVASKCLPPGR